MFVYPQDDFVSKQLADQSVGTWEQGELDNMQHALSIAAAAQPSQKPLFVDVGSNVGWFTLNAANLGARVYAFEGAVLDARGRLGYNMHATPCGYNTIQDQRRQDSNTSIVIVS